jgi:hypothetical protein
VRDLGDDARHRAVADRMHRVEPQPVEVVFVQPVERVVDVEVAHDARIAAVKVDRGAPRVLTPGVEELRLYACR